MHVFLVISQKKSALLRRGLFYFFVRPWKWGVPTIFHFSCLFALSPSTEGASGEGRDLKGSLNITYINLMPRN